MPRAKFYDDMGVGRRLPLAGGCYASARPSVDGGVVITVRDAKGRVLYGGDEIRPRGRFGDACHSRFRSRRCAKMLSGGQAIGSSASSCTRIIAGPIGVATMMTASIDFMADAGRMTGGASCVDFGLTRTRAKRARRGATRRERCRRHCGIFSDSLTSIMDDDRGPPTPGGACGRDCGIRGGAMTRSTLWKIIFTSGAPRTPT